MRTRLGVCENVDRLVCANIVDLDLTQGRHCLPFRLHHLHTLLGLVVQSIVSLMKSLVNDSLSLLVHLKSSVLIFFAEKM